MLSGLVSSSEVAFDEQQADSEYVGPSSWLLGELPSVVGAGEVLLLPVAAGGCLELQQDLGGSIFSFFSASCAALMAFSREAGFRLLLTDFRLDF